MRAKNLGIFTDLSINFSPRVNIIIGSNGTGKSTILKLLSYCFSFEVQDMIRFRPHAEFVSKIGGDTQRLIGLVGMEPMSKEYRQQTIYTYNPPESIENIKVDTPNSIEAYNYNLLAIGPFRQVNYSRIQGMQRESKTDEARKKYHQKNANALENSSMPNIKQWMINRYFMMEKSWARVQASNWLTITSILSTISPEKAKLEFNRIEEDLEPVFTLNGKECYLEELSSGFKSSLSIFFAITEWCEQVNDGDAALIENAIGTVMIDEVDAHLHPQWQATIVKNLADCFPKLQFIVTSHSPLVIANAEPNQVIKINGHNGIVELKPENISYNGWQLEYILEDVMRMIKVSSPPDDLLKAINESFVDRKLEKFDTELERLKQTLNPKDPIIQYYELRRANLLLDDSGQ